MSHHHLIYGFHLEPVVAVVTDGSVDALKVPTLEEIIKTWKNDHNKLNKG